MIRILFVSFFVIFLSCNNDKKGYAKQGNDDDPVYSVEADDRAMNAAVTKAALMYNQFLDAFNSGDTSLSGFSVKMKFPYDDGNEHMWLSGFFYKRDTLYGVLDSEPYYISDVTLGDTLAIDKSRVTDWLYVKDNKMVGGYTIKVLYNKMSPAEKRQMVETMRCEIE
jgi:uncharacterized protein YegJ (DUF2314 family)